MPAVFWLALLVEIVLCASLISSTRSFFGRLLAPKPQGKNRDPKRNHAEKGYRRSLRAVLKAEGQEPLGLWHRENQKNKTWKSLHESGNQRTQKLNRLKIQGDKDE
ncbi:hypothetical protein D1823_15380 [Ruegeria sp. AD91A]|uniref:hypothetical protein n=1 Tax=Ruegeria sp. AD91A TaxID=2293862 RepID=UPI000E4E692C|nr:hypothetical protein [Ruegeria sp. AD91A]AXT27822.1 hypothetical protein D1823_15380 [Ruegeria sp. AD91A]